MGKSSASAKAASTGKAGATSSEARTSDTAAAANAPQASARPINADAHVYLVDGSGYIFRAYFAMFKAAQSRGRNFARSDGTPTGAVMTFCTMLWKIVRDGLDSGDRSDDPTHIGVIFDHKGDSFRNEIYPDYKANREAPPDDLIPQFPLIRDAVRAFGLTPIEQERFEADDLIATYTVQAIEAGAKVTIISGDKDLMQLVGPQVRMFDPMPGREKLVTPQEVEEKFGVSPDKVVQVQALAGDSVDNVPGVPGIGIKTAAQLIQEFGDVETLLAKADTIKQKKRRENLIEFAEQARVSEKLVRLDQAVPLAMPLDALDLPEIDSRGLIAFAKAMEFRTFTKRVADAYDIDVDAIDADEGLAQTPDVVKARVDDERAASAAAHGTAPAVDGGADAENVVAFNTRAAKAAGFDVDAYETVTSMERLKAWIAEARDIGHVALDTETTSLDAMRADLVGLSLATRPGRACYVPIGHVRDETGGLDFGDAPAPDQLAIRDVLASLKPLLEDASVLKIGQNLKYDCLVLKRYGITLINFDDTLLLSYVLDAGARHHGMDSLADRHLGHKPIAFKTVIEHAPGKKLADKSFAGVPIDKATAYAAEDADLALRLWMILKPRLVQKRLVTVYETLERPLLPVLVDMEHAGITVDRTILSRLSGTFAQRAGALEQEVYDLVGEPFKLGSPKQLGELLFDKLQLPGGKKTKTGQWETRASLLDDLAANEELPEDARALVNTMLEWRQLTKLRSTYTEALQGHIHPDTQRIHTSYTMAGTTTGRLASTDPNLQNIPIRTKEGREIRTAFVARKGHKLISADYSQIELRVLAHIADIPQLKRAFDDGLDIHAMTASEMFDVPIKDMPAEVRRRAKAINFGIIYGISAFGLANQLGIPRSEARTYINTYFKRFPGIRTYMETTKQFARDHGFVSTIFGRRIHYPDIKSKNPSVRGFMERAAINAPIQGSAADIIRRAMVRMPDALADAGLTSTRMLLQVHDELIFEMAADEADAARKVVVDVMEAAALPAVQLSVPIKVDAAAADNWEAAH
ncbi:MAG: DNA polymerase I [Pseudomonadota bacterium]